MIVYNSTRGGDKNVSASAAIVKGLANDGGLYVPNEIPKLDIDLSRMTDMTYQEVAFEVLKRFYTDFTEDELWYCINNAYDDKFDNKEIAPLVQAGDDHYLELFHGSTIAFKDMALSILPYLMKVSAKKLNMDREIVILTATSGDTGKAALAGFAEVEGTRIVVFYPKDGVSPIQKQQMLTQKGDNTFVVGVDGNFDDCQTGVKLIFGDDGYNDMLHDKGFQLSSANSINIGRLIPQVAYYVYAYVKMMKDGTLKQGDDLNVTVPTGNFGNILAAYYAKAMGLPLGKLICASNDNKVLYDFMNSGKYDRKREFILTISPSMDILISSNLERLIYLIADGDTDKTASFMKQLVEEGSYEIDDQMKAGLSDFYGNYAEVEETYDTIKSVFDESKYLLDPHTAVGAAVAMKYKEETNDYTPMLIASTASPYKFTKSVMHALDDKYDQKDDFDLVHDMEKVSGVSIPKAVTEVIEADIRHKTICSVEAMKDTVSGFLGV